MPQSKEVHKEYMRRRREGLTEFTEGSQDYHPILRALMDPIKREKLERICESLGKRKLLTHVYYGMRLPVDFETVSELLEATQ